MNVLHLDEQRGWRGGEQQAGYLIRGLAERGHNVLIAGREGSPFITRDHGVPNLVRITAPFRNEADLTTAMRLARIIRREHVDIVHAHTSHTHAIALAARMIARRGKVVVSRRVDFSIKRTRLNRWKYVSPDQIVAISHTIADVLREFGVPDEKFTIVHSGIDPTRLDHPPISREKLGVPEGAPLFGNVAALVGHKDQATLIDAMTYVVDQLPGARLVIVGEGELRPKLERQIRELGLVDHVRLLGYRDDVPAILHALDVFVISSKEEGLGTSVLDAMACGVPVAATAAGGIPEMVRHESTGLLSRPQDAAALAENMVALYNDPEMRERLARNAKALVESSFTADAMVEGNIRVYEDVLTPSQFF